MYNRSKNLLKTTTPLKVQKRETMVDNMRSSLHRLSVSEVKLSLQSPLSDYKKLIDEKVIFGDAIPDEVPEANFSIIAASARETVWKLLFRKQPASAEDLNKAAELMEEYRKDAAFHSPWDYNKWCVKLRDEVLKCKMIDFWRDKMVKLELGPCWAKDSDYFDDMDDPQPAAFYEHAGCRAPFADGSTPSSETPLSPAVVPLSPSAATLSVTAITKENISDFTPTLNPENALEDYRNLINERVCPDLHIDDDVLQDNYKKISKAVREFIWKLLFDEPKATKDNLDKAGALLEEHKKDAAFYYPWDYNKWIVTVRDELLKRKMINFWRDNIVQNELGPCWAKDSDFFHDMEDPEPEAFYKHAGCSAPFSKK